MLNPADNICGMIAFLSAKYEEVESYMTYLLAQAEIALSAGIGTVKGRRLL